MTLQLVQAPAPRVLTLGEAQHTVFSSDARFRVLIAGRRFGKTHLAGVELLAGAIDRPGSINWYVGPTYRQAHMNLWRILVGMIPVEYLGKTPSESSLTIQLTNGSLIQLKGADNYDALRGPGLDLVIPDEFALMHKYVWDEILRPTLSDKMGRALFITTPKGFNYAYDLFQRGQNPETYPDWASWQFTTLDGGRVTAEEVASAKATMHPRIFEQEYMAGFTSFQDRVYDMFDRRYNVSREVEDLPQQELLVGQDFNINPMSSVLAVKVADQCHVFDELELPVSNTSEVAEELRRRFPGRKVHVFPDPSGRQRRTSAAGQTDFSILKQAGFTVSAPPGAPLVVDRINNTQAMCRAATGARRLFVHPRCVQLIRCLEGLAYKDNSRLPDKTSGLDHLPDALGYLLWQEFNVVQSRRFRESYFRI